jgi:hypothetical protein
VNKYRILQILAAVALMELALSGLSCASTPMDSALKPAMAPTAKVAAKENGDYLAGKLYKGTVTVEYFDTCWNTWKDREYHLDNLRVVLGDFSPELRRQACW